jgi:hypothetical protein
MRPSIQSDSAIKELMQIPGVGRSLATDLWNVGITSIKDLKRKDPEVLYELSNRYAGTTQDRCVLYVFRCAVYYASTAPAKRNPEKLKWWWWKDSTKQQQSKSTKK